MFTKLGNKNEMLTKMLRQPKLCDDKYLCNLPREASAIRITTMVTGIYFTSVMRINKYMHGYTGGYKMSMTENVIS